jgi:hypothetical protein
MTKSVRYQIGQLYPEHGAWFVRYRERHWKEDGSIKYKQHTQGIPGDLGESHVGPRRSDSCA